MEAQNPAVLLNAAAIDAMRCEAAKRIQEFIELELFIVSTLLKVAEHLHQEGKLGDAEGAQAEVKKRAEALRRHLEDDSWLNPAFKQSIMHRCDELDVQLVDGEVKTGILGLGQSRRNPACSQHYFPFEVLPFYPARHS